MTVPGDGGRVRRAARRRSLVGMGAVASAGAGVRAGELALGAGGVTPGGMV